MKIGQDVFGGPGAKSITSAVRLGLKSKMVKKWSHWPFKLFNSFVPIIIYLNAKCLDMVGAKPFYHSSTLGRCKLYFHFNIIITAVNDS